MTPVLRVIMPTANVSEQTKDKPGGKADYIFDFLGNCSDYIVDDPDGKKEIPPQAFYAARMDENGKITVVQSKKGGYPTPSDTLPDHTYAGWPIPA